MSFADEPRGHTSGLLERESEHAACLRALTAARAGRGSVIVIEGPPGIGKTQLLRTVREASAAAGAGTLLARGVEVHRSAPFGAVRQLLQSVFHDRASRSRLTGMARSAAGLFQPRGGADTVLDPAAMLEAVYWVCVDLSDRNPLVLLVDDAHWVDEPSMQFLRFLQSRIEEVPVLAVIATRTVGSGDSPTLGQIVADPTTRVLPLGPLSHTAVAALVRAELGGAPDEEFIDACVTVTGGNPYFVSELLVELGQRAIAPVRDSVPLVSAVRTDGISRALRFRHVEAPDAFALARALAVVEDGIPLPQVAEIAELSAETAAVVTDGLTRASIAVATEGRLAFAHPIVRTSVYAALTPHERAAAHRRAARVLARSGAPPHVVASHLLRAEPQGDPTVVEALRRAAAASLASGAPAAAVTYLRRAIAEHPAAPERALLLLDLGRAEMMCEEVDAASRHFLEACSATADPALQTAAVLDGALALFLAGRGREAVQLLTRAAGDLPDGDRDAALRVEAQIASIALFDPEASQAQQARLANIDERALGTSIGERMMACHLGYRRMLRAENAGRAGALVRRAVDGGQLVAALGGESAVVAQAVMTLIFADEPTAAAALIDEALVAVRESGSRHGHAQVHFWRSILANRTGRPADAEIEAEASLALIIAAGPTVPVAVATAELVVARMELGRLREAEDALRATGMLEGDVPAPVPYTPLLSARGRLRVALGDERRGLADLLECGDRKGAVEAENPVVMPWRGEAAFAFRLRGDLIEARRLAERDMRAARAWGTPSAVGTSLRVLALVGAPSQAIPRLNEAVSQLSASPARLEHARALVDLGAALRRENQRGVARDHLQQAVQLARDHDARAIGERARAELAALGVRVPRTPSRGTHDLTASERRVAALAARGRSNRQIAQELFVTTKTVEKHLANAYSKLGVESRHDLADHLQPQ